MKKIKVLFILAIFLLLILPLNKPANADLGPKPTVKIDVLYNNAPITDATFKAKILECRKFPEFDEQNQKGTSTLYQSTLPPKLRIMEYDKDKNCYWIPASMAWGEDCEKSSCKFTYMIPDTFKVEVWLPSTDKVYISDSITTKAFNGTYKVLISSNGKAKIINTKLFNFSPNTSEFLVSVFITLLLELLITAIYCGIKKKPKGLIKLVFIGNLITLPIVWFVFPLLKIIPIISVLLSELFAVIAEGYILYKFGGLTLKQSLILSAINNTISVILGTILVNVLIVLGRYLGV